jgi:predicted dinucleotide-binding enzyme
MKIAVLGLGNVGRTLGVKWFQSGHEVVFGVRDLDSPKVQGFRAENGAKISIAPISQAVAFGEVVVFAVPGSAVPAIVDAYADELNEKIIVDTTNYVAKIYLSAVAILAARSPDARVFRAFNTLGWENFAQPQFGEIQADLFYCGPEDSPALKAVEALIADIGLRPIYVGGLDQVNLLDGVTRLWFALVNGRKMGRRLAFKVLMSEE